MLKQLLVGRPEPDGTPLVHRVQQTPMWGPLGHLKVMLLPLVLIRNRDGVSVHIKAAGFLYLRFDGRLRVVKQ